MSKDQDNYEIIFEYDEMNSIHNNKYTLTSLYCKLCSVTYILFNLLYLYKEFSSHFVKLNCTHFYSQAPIH